MPLPCICWPTLRRHQFGASVREGDRWTPCEVVTETIKVRGGPDVVERVLITPRGRVVSPAMEGVTVAISMRAVTLEPAPAGT